MFRLIVLLMTLLGALTLLAGCGPGRSGSAAGSVATTMPGRQAVPTFTPTVIAAALTPVAPATAVPVATAIPATSAPADGGTNGIAAVAQSAAPAIPEVAPAQEEAASIALAEAEPSLTINVDAANVRSGPDVAYPQVGVAARAAQYPLSGRNQQGDWWQVCCFDSQPGWLYGELVTVQNPDSVALVADVPPLPTPLSTENVVAVEAHAAEAAPDDPVTPAAVPPVDSTAEPPLPEPIPAGQGRTAGNFDPNAQYQIVHYRVLGFADNNGGIFNKGGQQIIIATVLDQGGNPVDGAVLKDAVGDTLNVISGSKGPGRAEIKMD